VCWVCVTPSRSRLTRPESSGGASDVIAGGGSTRAPDGSTRCARGPLTSSQPGARVVTVAGRAEGTSFLPPGGLCEIRNGPSKLIASTNASDDPPSIHQSLRRRRLDCRAMWVPQDEGSGCRPASYHPELATPVARNMEPATITTTPSGDLGQCGNDQGHRVSTSTSRGAAGSVRTPVRAGACAHLPGCPRPPSASRGLTDAAETSRRIIG
jgi:hypothetical protein